MAENLYWLTNCATPTTGAPTKQPSSTSANCMLQLAVPTTRLFNLIEYGFSCDGSPAGMQVWLMSTSTTATTTHLTAGSILPFNNQAAPASLATSSYYNAYGATAAVTPEGTVNQLYDNQVLTANTYIKQWPLGREPVVGVPGTAYYLQINCLVPTTAVNVSCYLIWRE